MPSSMIIGITGQDGHFLATLLEGAGISVVGVVRDQGAKSVEALSHRFKNIHLVEWDMRDEASMEDILRENKIIEVYNLAAYASGAGMYDQPADIGDVNGLAVTRILEAIRRVDRGIKFCQASSSEVFGEASESPQTEETRRNPRSPYGAAKQYADSIINVYRRHHGLFACAAFLYNHESPRRSPDFVTRKITRQAVEVKLGKREEVSLGNLDTLRDWGYAGDYVRAMQLMLQHDVPDDYIVATGQLHSVRDFCACAFGYLGLDYREFVRVEPSFFRPQEAVPLVGDASKARRVLGWAPRVGFEELVKMMVEADMQDLSGQLVNKVGHV